MLIVAIDRRKTWALLMGNTNHRYRLVITDAKRGARRRIVNFKELTQILTKELRVESADFVNALNLIHERRLLWSIEISQCLVEVEMWTVHES